jgi:lipopolysaccharide export system protein LptA
MSAGTMSAGTNHSFGRPAPAGSGTACNILVAAIFLATLAAADAAAQKSPPQNQGPPNALQGFSQNRDQPVNIQSDTLVVRDKEKIATFSGNVHLTQGDTEMRSKSLVVYYLDESKPAGAPATAPKAVPGAVGAGEQKIRKVEATGGVTVTQKDQNAFGDTGTLDVQQNVVTLSGNVVIARGKDVLRGQRLTVDLTTGVSKIDGGRVEALFGTPPNSGANGLPGLPGLAPPPSR